MSKVCLPGRPSVLASISWRSSFQVWPSFIVQTSWHRHPLSSIQNCPWYVFISKSIQPHPRPNLRNLNSCALDPPFCRLTLSQRSFYPYAPTLWNYLPEIIVQCKVFVILQGGCSFPSCVIIVCPILSCLVCHFPCCFFSHFSACPLLYFVWCIWASLKLIV